MGVWMHKGRPYDFGQLRTKLARMKKELPPVLANEAVNFFKDRFKEEGWKDRSFQKWPPRKPGAKRPGRALLVDRGHLKNSIRPIKTTFAETSVGTNIHYASAHNEGVKQTVKVRSHTRRVTRVKRAKGGSQAKSTTVVRAHNRKMNLLQRQFIGHSWYFENKILIPAIDEEVMRIFE